MNILYLCSEQMGLQGGAYVHIEEMVGHLRARGHRVDLLNFALGRGLEQAGRWGAAWRRLGQVLAMPWLTARAIRRLRPDIVYQREMALSALPAVAARACRVPHILEVNGIAVDEARWRGKGWWTRALLYASQHLSCRLSARIVCVMRPLADTLRQMHRLMDDRLVIVHNGANPERFKPVPMDLARAELGLDPDDDLVCFVGTFYPHHGVDLLVQAAGRLVLERPRLKFLLVGDGATRQRIEHEVAARGLSAHFLFVGRIPYKDTARFVNASDVCVMIYNVPEPRRWGFSPIKLYQYQACGKPVVTLTNTALSIDPAAVGRTVLVTELRGSDTSRFESELLSLLGDPERREAMGRQARADILARHTWSRAAIQVEEVLRAVLPYRAPAHHPRPLNILYACGIDLSVQYGGTTHVREIIRQFDEVGHDVTLVAPPREHAQEPLPCPVETVQMRGWGRVRHLFFRIALLGRLFSVALRRRPDLIYEREVSMNVSTMLVSRLLGIPHVVEVNGLTWEETLKRTHSRLLGLLVRITQQVTFRRAKGIITVSTRLEETLTRRYRLKPAQFRIVPNGVDERRFRPMDPARCQARLGLKADRTYLVFVGSFYPHHSLQTLVQAAPAILAAHPKVHFLLVGDGVQRPVVEAEVRRKGLSEHFTFTGEVPFSEVPHYVGAATLCVVLLRNQLGRGYGCSAIKLFEYLACGRPVVLGCNIATDHDVVSLVRDTDTGESWSLVGQEEEDARILSDKILALLDDPERMRACGMRGRELAISGHTWRHSADQTVGFLGELLHVVPRGRSAPRRHDAPEPVLTAASA